MNKPVYTLRRLNWRKSKHVWHRLPGTTRLATFAGADEADAERTRLEDKARSVVNPFRCGTSLADRTSLDDGRLADWLLDAGITPPAKPPALKVRDWAAWWEQNRAAMSDYQRGKVWQACDRLRFHEVVEGPARPVVYVVVEIPWHYTDEDFFASEEGGASRRIFRTRAAAEAFCNSHRADWSDEPFDMTTRRAVSADPMGPDSPREEVWFRDDAAPGFDVIEVEVMD